MVVARAWHWSNRQLPQGWLDAFRQLLLIVGAYYAYRIVRGAALGNTVAAFVHARSIVGLERGAHLFFEPALQKWALSDHWIVDVSNWVYINSHFLVTLGFLTWLYFARNESFYFVRNTFMIGMGLALVGYAVFPSAPPRMLPEWGFTDTVSNWVGASASSTAGLFYNPYAAVPSMHVAFAVLVGLPAARLMRRRLLKVAWSLYPVLITFTVLVTANHFWIDAALGTLVAALATAAASAGLARARPHAWSWRTAGATA